MFTEILYYLSNLSISVLIILSNTNASKIKDAIFMFESGKHRSEGFSKHTKNTLVLFDEGNQLLYKAKLLNFMIDYVLAVFFSELLYI